MMDDGWVGNWVVPFSLRQFETAFVLGQCIILPIVMNS